MLYKHTSLHSQSAQQSYSRRSEDQRACRPHKPDGGQLLFRNAKTFWEKGQVKHMSKNKTNTCSYKGQATTRLLAPHSQACDRTHRWGWWCWLVVRRQEGG